MEQQESLKKRLNIVGPTIRKLRDRMGLTQDMLAARCNVLGLNISRSTLAKIEMQIRCCTDQELIALAKALKVKLKEILPTENSLF